jgi:hypothetical protein
VLGAEVEVPLLLFILLFAVPVALVPDALLPVALLAGILLSLAPEVLWVVPGLVALVAVLLVLSSMGRLTVCCRLGVAFVPFRFMSLQPGNAIKPIANPPKIVDFITSSSFVYV